MTLFVHVALLAALNAAPDAPTAPVAEPAAGPRTMVVGTYLNNLTNIDLKNNQYTIDFYVWFRWEGDDLKPMDSFELPGGRIVSKTGLQRKKLGNQNYLSARIVATVTHFWDLRRFPLDGHTLTLELEDAENDTRVFDYRVDADNVGVSPDLQVPGWVLKSSHPEVERHVYRTNYGDTSFPTNRESAYSRYRFTLELERPGFGRFWKVFFGLFISTLVSWCGFWVRPKESSPRVSLGVGATFAASAVTVTINNMLPDTNAVTMADKLVWLTLGLIVLGLAETITALTLFGQGKEAAQQRMDKVCRGLFPAIYLVVLGFIVFT